MAISFQQTDTSKTPQAACSGHSAGGTTKARECTIGGSAGTTSTTIGTDADNRYCWNDISGQVGSGIDWDSGTMTWRLHVTSGNSNFRLEKVYVCRLNSSEVSQQTLGSDTTMNTSMTTGTHTGTITLSAGSSPSSTDKFATVFIFDNDAGGHGGSSIQVKPSQLIDMPFNYTPAEGTLDKTEAADTISASGTVTTPPRSLALPHGYRQSMGTLLRTI